MKISQSGFYNISKFSDSILEIDDGLDVYLYDDETHISSLLVGKNSKVRYFGFFFGKDDFKKHILLHSEESDVEVKVLSFASQKQLKVDVAGEIASSRSKIQIDIISLVGEDGNIDIDGKIQIDENIEKVEGYLRQENIFLAQTGKIRGVPTLLVRSNDVKASHGCKIDRISDETLFYMRSRGVSKQTAIQLIIASYFERIFGNLREKENDFVEGVLEKFTSIL